MLNGGSYFRYEHKASISPLIMNKKKAKGHYPPSYPCTHCDISLCVSSSRIPPSAFICRCYCHIFCGRPLFSIKLKCICVPSNEAMGGSKSITVCYCMMVNLISEVSKQHWTCVIIFNIFVRHLRQWLYREAMSCLLYKVITDVNWML